MYDYASQFSRAYFGLSLHSAINSLCIRNMVSHRIIDNYVFLVQFIFTLVLKVKCLSEAIGGRSKVILLCRVFLAAVFVSLRSILMVELIGLNKLTNAFGLVTMCQGLSAFIGAPLAGRYIHIYRNTHTHTHTHTLPPLFTHTHTHPAHVLTHTRTHTHTHTHD